MAQVEEVYIIPTLVSVVRPLLSVLDAKCLECSIYGPAVLSVLTHKS